MLFLILQTKSNQIKVLEINLPFLSICPGTKLKDCSCEIHFAMSDVKLPKPSIYTFYFVTSVIELLDNNRLTFLLLFDCSIYVKLVNSVKERRRETRDEIILGIDFS